MSFLIFSDTICDLGGVDELANYGEYSGAPSEQQTYDYAKTILSLMTREKHPEGKSCIHSAHVCQATVRKGSGSEVQGLGRSSLFEGYETFPLPFLPVSSPSQGHYHVFDLMAVTKVCHQGCRISNNQNISNMSPALSVSLCALQGKC